MLNSTVVNTVRHGRGAVRGNSRVEGQGRGQRLVENAAEGEPRVLVRVS